MELNRREFLRGAVSAGVAVVLNRLTPHTAEAADKERTYRLLSSSLTPEVLANQKQKAIDSLTNSIPDDPKLGYLRENARNLSQESQMYIPTTDELRDVVQKNEPQLQELARQILPDSFGLFIFADADENANRIQRMYVIKKLSNGTDVEFVKSYLVSAASGGFGNAKDSNQTPLGIHHVHNGKRGLFGEVVSGLNKYKELFNHVVYNGLDHWFVKGFGGRNGGNDIAEVVTDQYLLVGKHTSPERGIRIHGTNRSGEFDRNGAWKTFLGGRTRSGGCIRMSNVDVRDLGLSGYISLPSKEQRVGTSVMIAATDAAQRTFHKFSEEEIKLRPPRWQPRTQPLADGEMPTVTPGRPARWKPTQ